MAAEVRIEKIQGCLQLALIVKIIHTKNSVLQWIFCTTNWLEYEVQLGHIWRKYMQSKMILKQIIGYSRMSSCKYCKNMENDHSSFDCRTGFDSGSLTTAKTAIN